MSEGGGILRNSAGCMIFALSGYFGSYTSIQAEAKTLLLVLQLYAQRGIDGNLVVETHSLMLQRILLKRYQCLWSISAKVEYIELVSGGRCQILYCYREANKVADIMANVGSAHPQHVLYVYERLADLPKMARGDYRLNKLGFPSFRRFRVTGATSKM